MPSARMFTWVNHAQVVSRARINVVMMEAARVASVLGRVRLITRGCSRRLTTIVFQLPQLTQDADG